MCMEQDQKSVPRHSTTIESTDGYYTPDDAVPDSTLTADDLIDNQFNATELELLGLPTDTVVALADRVDEIPIEDLGRLEETYRRARYYAEDKMSDRDWEDAYYTLIDRIKDEYGFRASAIPSYTNAHTAEYPESVGIVASRLLVDWVAEMTVVAEENLNSRNRSTKTIVATVNRDFNFSGTPVGFSGAFNDRAWELEDNDGNTFALAPIGEGEDTTLWLRDPVNEKYDTRYAVTGITTYPNKTAWEADSEEAN